MVDFQLSNLCSLQKILLSEKYEFRLFRAHISLPSYKHVKLRRGVDLKLANSRALVKLEYSLEVKGAYCLGINYQTLKADIIKVIAAYEDGIGHYNEDGDQVYADTLIKQIDLTFSDYCKILDKLRMIIQINSICIYGSIREKYDNKLIWSKYNYCDISLIGKP